MTENKEVLDKLMQKSSPEKVDWNSVPTGKEDEVLITSSRVVWVRYKVYSIILLLLIFVLWYNYLFPNFDKFQNKRIELSDMELQALNFENKKNQYDANKWLVDKIWQVESQVVTCLNELKWCKELPNTIQQNFGIVRSYLLLGEMKNHKMDLDEKAIIANIDSFLLKKDPFNENSSTMNGILNKISIWDKEQFEQSLYFVPIELNITFANRDWLLSFIDNVEKKIPIEKDLRMLYKIDNINYDVVNSNETQDVDIYMYLYFYES